MRILITYLLVLFTVSSCKREDKYPDVRILGHAGAGLDMATSPYHENTLESIKYSLSYPEISGVEVDIQWSKDGTIWLFHDELLETQTNGEGCLHTKTDSELEDVHFKGINQEKLIRLNDAAPVLANKQVILDLKIFGCGESIGTAEFEDPFSDFNGLLSNTTVLVVVQDLSKAAFFQSLGWKVYLEVQSATHYLSVVNSNPSNGCVIRNAAITKEEVSQIQSLGKEVIIFDARSPKTIRQSLRKVPDIFLADDIKATLIEKIK